MAETLSLRCLGSSSCRGPGKSALAVRLLYSSPRLALWAVSSFRQSMEGVPMVFLTNLLFGLFFVAFSYWLVVARTRRQVLALTLAGVLAVALVTPPTTQAQGSLVTAIQSVLNVINGTIQT